MAMQKVVGEAFFDLAHAMHPRLNYPTIPDGSHLRTCRLISILSSAAPESPRSSRSSREFSELTIARAAGLAAVAPASRAIS